VETKFVSSCDTVVFNFIFNLPGYVVRAILVLEFAPTGLDSKGHFEIVFRDVELITAVKSVELLNYSQL
jgi:hypothetical protein